MGVLYLEVVSDSFLPFSSVFLCSSCLPVRSPCFGCLVWWTSFLYLPLMVRGSCQEVGRKVGSRRTTFAARLFDVDLLLLGLAGRHESGWAAARCTIAAGGPDGCESRSRRYSQGGACESTRFLADSASLPSSTTGQALLEPVSSRSYSYYSFGTSSRQRPPALLALHQSDTAR